MTHLEQLWWIREAIRRVVVTGVDGVGQRGPIGKRAKVSAVGTTCKFPSGDQGYFPLLVSESGHAAHSKNRIWSGSIPRIAFSTLAYQSKSR